MVNIKFRVLSYVPDVALNFILFSDVFFTVNFKNLVGEQTGVMRLTGT